MDASDDVCVFCVAGFASLFQGSNLRPLTIGMSLMLLQQITGQPSVLYYVSLPFCFAHNNRVKSIIVLFNP